MPKDPDFDRLIINPKVINSRMHSISDFTRSLAPGAMLGLLHLNPDDIYRFSADDLTDFYYTFKVTGARAFRNAIRCVFSREEVEHLSCFDRSVSHSHYLIALKTLAMGDSLAVEIAQQAHYNVLKRLCGAMRAGEVLKYRHPCPRGDFIELLAIDDHVGVQRLKRVDLKSKPSLRVTDIFEAAEKAYKKVGLIQHEKKRKRDLTAGTILGCDFDGITGRAMAPRNRISILCLLSITLARIGTCTPKLLSVIVGCWVHVLLYRRVMFAVIDALFREGKGLPPNQVFCLTRQSRNELQLLGMIGPLAQSDLRVSYSPNIFVTDASPDGGAVCVAPVGSKVTEELWRHTEQKGFHTRLQSPVSAYLSEKGLDSLAAQQYHDEKFQPEAEIFEVPKPLEEGILFDCIEIFRGSGGWSAAHSCAGLRVHDGIDIDGKRLRAADLADSGTCRELVSLVLRRVVKEWHAGMPCVSFGTLRRPQVRSKAMPYGFNPSDAFTSFHNMLAHRTALILVLAIKHGQFISVEQPEGSRLFLLHCYKVLVTLGCVITRFAFCQYGSGFQKRSKWLHNKPWLVPLGSRCNCDKPHFVIQGTFTQASIKAFNARCDPDCITVYGRDPKPGERVSSFSGAYPKTLMAKMAEGSRAAHAGSSIAVSWNDRIAACQEVGIDVCELQSILPQHAEYPLRAWHEDPEWITELCECLSFKEMFRFRFKPPGHINVNETRTYKTWLKAMSKREPDSRFVGILDSRVTIGASAKGRSSSYALSRVLKGCVAYSLGSGLYPGCLHCGSKHNRADEPSRGKPVRGPTKDYPRWLSDLSSGNPHAFDCVLASCRYERNPARWLRFLLLLAGDIERNPGPESKSKQYVPRGDLDMRVGFAAATFDRMQKCLIGFRRWIVTESDIPWSKLVQSPCALVLGLRAYGLYCFSAGLPRYMFVYAVTAVQDQRPTTKEHMHLAWHVDKKWQAHEPGQCRAVLSSQAVRAILCLAAVWNWFPWLGAVMLGFGAMLHPSEILNLKRGDLVFPRDVDHDMSCMFLHIRNPKTARFARRQHGRIDDQFMIWVAEHIFFDLPLEAKIFPETSYMFRKRWDLIMQRLGIPCKQSQRGATPGVLRGSGATFLYTMCEDVQWIAWRGRWARTRTLEFYLQEVAAQLLLHQLSPTSRAAIREFDRLSAAVLCFRLSSYGVGG